MTDWLLLTLVFTGFAFWATAAFVVVIFAMAALFSAVEMAQTYLRDWRFRRDVRRRKERGDG